MFASTYLTSFMMVADCMYKLSTEEKNYSADTKP